MLHTLHASLVIALVAALPATAQQKSVREMAPHRVSTKNSAPLEFECERFGLALEEAVRLGEQKSAEDLVDWNAIYVRATNGIPAPERTRTTFHDSAEAELKGTDGVMASLVRTVASGGSFRLLRVIEGVNESQAFFRLTHIHGGVPDYVTFYLEADGEGAARAIDIDRLSEGDLLSVRLRRYFLALASGATRNLEQKVRGVDRLRVRWQNQLEAADEAFLAGRNREVLETLADLPDELARDRAVLLTRLNAARSISPKMFAAVLAHARDISKNDIAVERVALDQFLELKSLEEARVALRTLSDSIGGDGYLDWISACIEEDAGDTLAARAACARAIALDDRLQEPWWTLLSINVREQNYSEALRNLESLNGRFDVDWSGLEAASGYRAFFQSEYGRAWKTRIASRR